MSGKLEFHSSILQNAIEIDLRNIRSLNLF